MVIFNIYVGHCQTVNSTTNHLIPISPKLQGKKLNNPKIDASWVDIIYIILTPHCCWCLKAYINQYNMWVKQCHTPSPSHHHEYIGGINLPFPVLSWYHSFANRSQQIPTVGKVQRINSACLSGSNLVKLRWSHCCDGYRMEIEPTYGIVHVYILYGI